MTDMSGASQRGAVAREPVSRDEDDNPVLLTARDVSPLAGIAPSTLHQYALQAEAGLPQLGPPHLRLGPRRRRWLKRDVLAWLETSRVGVASDAQVARPSRQMPAGQLRASGGSQSPTESAAVDQSNE